MRDPLNHTISIVVRILAKIFPPLLNKHEVLKLFKKNLHSLPYAFVHLTRSRYKL